MLPATRRRRGSFGGGGGGRRRRAEKFRGTSGSVERGALLGLEKRQKVDVAAHAVCAALEAAQTLATAVAAATDANADARGRVERAEAGWGVVLRKVPGTKRERERGGG